MIIGVGGCVLTIDNWLHVLMVNRGYATEGSGGEVALGALYATSALAPRVRVYLALEAACSLLTDCGAPFVIKEMVPHLVSLFNTVTTEKHFWGLAARSNVHFLFLEIDSLSFTAIPISMPTIVRLLIFLTSKGNILE
jgi:hypothetical protein